MNSTATLKWIGLALLGVAVAATVAIAASNLASQQIGLASEPISAGDALAPAASQNRGHGSQIPGHGHGHGHGDRTAPTATTTTPTLTPEPEATMPTAPDGEPTTPTNPSNGARDDHGSGGHGADD